MSEINFPTTMSGNVYTGNIENNTTINADKKISFTDSTPPSENSVKDKGTVSNRGFTPDTPKGNVEMTALRDWLVATPSPGAMLAALCVKEAAQQNEQNTAELLKRNEAVQKDILQQADDIQKGALKQMIFSLIGAAVSGVGSAVAGVKTLRIASGTEGLALQKAMVAPNNWTQAGKSLNQAFEAVGNYLNAQDQADIKKQDAAIEQSRTMMEAIKNSMQAQRDLMSKSLEFMNSMQANMNQTMTRIMA